MPAVRARCRLPRGAACGEEVSRYQRCLAVGRRSPSCGSAGCRRRPRPALSPLTGRDRALRNSEAGSNLVDVGRCAVRDHHGRRPGWSTPKPFSSIGGEATVKVCGVAVEMLPE